MAGNSIGELFKVTTWGESHGAAIGAIIDGCPADMELTQEDIQKELDRRRPGKGGHATRRAEGDQVEILSGVFEGRTTGTPISLLIRNSDVRSRDYESLRKVLRPGHGDYTYLKKYGIRDYRGGGRASGRETAARVAAGAVAKKVIASLNIRIKAYTRELGGVVARDANLDAIAENPLLCPDTGAVAKMLKKLNAAAKKGDTLGGIVEVVVIGCPPGLGEPVFDKMDADLAKALMSIGTVKGVEIGAGFGAARMKGSLCNDSISPEGFLTNNAGGILAGITNGEDIIIRVACKPIPSISLPQQTVDERGEPVSITVAGRHDVCVIPRIIPVCEAMAAIVLADHLLRQRAICR